MKVDLDAAPRIGATLAARAAEGGSGILTAVRGRLKRLFVVDGGWLVHAASNVVEEQLVEYLVRRGAIAPTARGPMLEEAERRGRKLYELALETGTPSPVAFRAAMEAMIGDLLTSTLQWPDGQSTWQAGRPALDGDVTVRLPVLPLLLAHAKQHPAAVDALRARIGPPDTKPFLSAAARRLLGATELDEAGRYLCEASDGTRGLGALLAGSPAREEPTLRTLYGLVLAGIVERAGRPSADQREAPLGRDECALRLSLAAEADHYAVLGLDRKATAGQVRDAYYALARRYHPDRFRSGPLADLLGLAETFFARVTEASNTLSRPEARKEYDQQLAEPATEPAAAKSDTQYLARQNFLRAKALLERRHWAEAGTFLENAVKLDSGVAEYQLELGQLLARNPRRRDDAERHLLRAAELEPTSVTAYLVLGQMHARAGRRAAAAAMYREVLRWEPGHAQASALLADLGPVEV